VLPAVHSHADLRFAAKAKLFTAGIICRSIKSSTCKMSDDDDFVFEVTDAGASATIPMEAGQVKKGG
jgi:hypothetical protein